MSKWIFVDDAFPREGEYVLVKTAEDSPIGIDRFIDGEWENGGHRKRRVFDKKEKFYTSASVVLWMTLPLELDLDKEHTVD